LSLLKKSNSIAIIGAGPAGLMAADVLSEAGLKPLVFDAMPSAARKFLRAVRGGLNLTHAEEFSLCKSRYF
jgi:predicted flavoprotein YhiN